MTNLSVAIVGGGLVGALEACLLAQRGFKVTLFEGRHDGRGEPAYFGRSINLAISVRGIAALERLKLEHIVADHAIPMKARMIHGLDGSTKPIPYDPDGRCINSIERSSLNNLLLNKAEQEFQVELKFNHKLVDMAAERGELLFDVRGQESRSDASEGEVRLARYKFDLILGCDGARSAVRGLLARQTQLELSQSYIEHGYLELRIEPSEEGGYRMAPNYLHIWPRGQYMMIALPNKDASFTCTLFMPLEILGALKEPGAALSFFERNFPDSVELIGAQRIADTLASVRASSLISIKCKPYFFKDKVGLLGDAAHAMVPFYGQGMNCGFEDCLVFDELLDRYMSGEQPGEWRSQIGKVLEEYSRLRCANGHSMCDLAMYNYTEMRDLVNTWSFMMRKQLDNLLYRCFPNKWIPLYTMVTFTRIPIDECVRRRANQNRLLERCEALARLTLWAGLVLVAGLQARRHLM